MGNKKKLRQQTPTRTEPKIFIEEEEGEAHEQREKKVKRSVSFSGRTRPLNPFSILPDYDSDRNGDFDSDEDRFIPPKRGRQSSLSMNTIPSFTSKGPVGRKGSLTRNSSEQSLKDLQFNPPVKNRLLTSQSLTGLSNLLNLGSSNVTQINSSSAEPSLFNDPDETESKRSMVSSKKSKKQKKIKATGGTLKMYDDTNEVTKLPSPAEINEIFHHLNEARIKIFQASVRFWTYIAVKSLAFIVILIQLILLVFQYIWLVLSTIFYHIMRVIFSAFPFLNSLLLHKHDHKDPFKRTMAPSGAVVGYEDANLNGSEGQQTNATRNYDEYNSTRKLFSLALDLDETLIYTIPMIQDDGKKGKNKQIDLLDDEEEVKVFHPSSKQEQVFKLRKRPHLDIFLLEMSKLFNLIIYSSAPKQYVDAMVDSIDSNRLIVKRLYRDHCIKCPGIYIKDLQHVGDIQSTIILDCLAEATKLDSENAIIIKKFRGERTDSELTVFSKILSFIASDSIKKGIALSSALHDFKGTYL